MSYKETVISHFIYEKIQENTIYQENTFLQSLTEETSLSLVNRGRTQKKRKFQFFPGAKSSTIVGIFPEERRGELRAITRPHPRMGPGRGSSRMGKTLKILKRFKIL